MVGGGHGLWFLACMLLSSCLRGDLIMINFKAGWSNSAHLGMSMFCHVPSVALIMLSPYTNTYGVFNGVYAGASSP